MGLKLKRNESRVLPLAACLRPEKRIDCTAEVDESAGGDKPKQVQKYIHSEIDINRIKGETATSLISHTNPPTRLLFVRFLSLRLLPSRERKGFANTLPICVLILVLRNHGAQPEGIFRLVRDNCDAGRGRRNVEFESSSDIWLSSQAPERRRDASLCVEDDLFA